VEHGDDPGGNVQDNERASVARYARYRGLFDAAHTHI
jgi:hypothetical protein